MKVVLYGQSGQVGEAILKKIKNDFEWQLPARTSPEGDFSCPEKLAAFLFQEKPDAVINAAAFTAVDEASRRFDEALTINATAPGIIARTCSQIGAYFIHLSTDYVFDGKGDSPWRESDKTSPVNAYGLTKLRGEEEVLAQAPDSLILRLSWLHAANHSNFITAFCRRLQTQSVVSVVDDQFGSPTAADDVADVIGKILFLKQEGIVLSGIYHFANSGFCSRFECAEEILRQLQSAGISWTFDKTLKRAKTTDFPAMDPRPLNCRLDTQKLSHAIKIAPRTWQEALGATLRQYF